MTKNTPLMIVALILIATTAGSAAAQKIDHAARYKTCMAESKTAPQRAFEMALSWRGLGGGDAAEHCVAAALIGLKQYVQAAKRLEALVDKSRQDAAVKAGLLAHAAQAWMLAENNTRAEAVLTAALGLTPWDADLMVDRAQARAGKRDYNGAIEDLNRAIESGNRPADAYVFRGTAYRRLDRLELALADIERGLVLQPAHPDGLLERGILRRLRDNTDGARQDWLSVIRLAPEGQAADVARRYLENMDVKPDK